MSDREYSVQRVAQTQHVCTNHFSLPIQVSAILFDDIEGSKESYTTLFSTTKGDVYALTTSDAPLLLVDVRNMMRSMNIEPAAYAAPGGDKGYFMRRGHEAFRNTYPGRSSWSSQEALFYQTLAPYSPALVKVARIKDAVRSFNTSTGRWHKAYEFSYNISQKVAQHA